MPYKASKGVGIGGLFSAVGAFNMFHGNVLSRGMDDGPMSLDIFPIFHGMAILTR